ncbi:Holliday junction resolvase RuvX [Saprospira sp. CCB-QB6]|uniref:Holliday junction resolvase RuvX n=1 Tax=Saprospira sp. CCB-QB6 TaxID=3023936 RepID=UPI00234A0A77|nr:Holliday junction resolvase RuvX [Saprospira sp. CCB-QB6]WCL82255.1 Holliday junction resolvase RuvX [Saprospira sp. CCB-QB6]
MARIMALDYGKRRSGLATTDPLQLIASPLCTVATEELYDYLCNYLQEEEVDALVVGQVLQKDGQPVPQEAQILEFIAKLQKRFPNLKVHRQDEHFTSQMAKEVIRFSVKKKKKRQEKGLVDQVSAAIILQEYMGFL